MNITETILVGIATAAIVAFCVLVYKKILLPFVRDVISGFIIRNTWVTSITTPSGNRQEMTLKLKQRHNVLTGKLEVIKHIKKTGLTETKSFDITGSIENRFVILNGRNLDKHSVGVATWLLEIIGDGSTITGLGIWYSVTDKKITTSEYIWTATNSGNTSTEE